MPAAAPDGGVPSLCAHCRLLAHDGRSGLEGDAEVHRLAVGDPALYTAAAVRARAHAIAVHVERVIVLEPSQVGAGKAGADLEALAGGQAQHRASQVCLETV